MDIHNAWSSVKIGLRGIVEMSLIQPFKANSDDAFFDARRGCVKTPPVFCEIGIDLNSMPEIVDNRAAFVCEWLISHTL